MVPVEARAAITEPNSLAAAAAGLPCRRCERKKGILSTTARAPRAFPGFFGESRAFSARPWRSKGDISVFGGFLAFIATAITADSAPITVNFTEFRAADADRRPGAARNAPFGAAIGLGPPRDAPADASEHHRPLGRRN